MYVRSIFRANFLVCFHSGVIENFMTSPAHPRFTSMFIFHLCCLTDIGKSYEVIAEIARRLHRPSAGASVASVFINRGL